MSILGRRHSYHSYGHAGHVMPGWKKGAIAALALFFIFSIFYAWDGGRSPLAGTAAKVVYGLPGLAVSSIVSLRFDLYQALFVQPVFWVALAFWTIVGAILGLVLVGRGSGHHSYY